MKDNEAEARREREKARDYLEQKCCGPSRRELEQEKNGLLISNVREEAAVGDNTLVLLAAQRRRKAAAAAESNIEEKVVKKQKIEKKGPIWKQCQDPSTGDLYYWNTETQETTWDNPLVKKEEIALLPKGWEQVVEEETGDVYYWNKESNETTWDKPQFAAVSIEEAIAARAKLDLILERK